MSGCVHSKMIFNYGSSLQQNGRNSQQSGFHSLKWKNEQRSLANSAASLLQPDATTNYSTAITARLMKCHLYSKCDAQGMQISVCVYSRSDEMKKCSKKSKISYFLNWKLLNLQWATISWKQSWNDSFHTVVYTFRGNHF